jgi:hypothetical protein
VYHFDNSICDKFSGLYEQLQVPMNAKRIRKVQLKPTKCQVVLCKLTCTVFMTQEHSGLPPCVVIKPTACFQWLPCYKGLRFQFGEQRILYPRTCPFQINPSWHKLKACLFGRFVEISYVFFFQWLFQSIQGPGLLFSSVIIFHRR